MTDKKIVLTIAGSQEEARRLARALLERRLAACVNIVPQVESIYRWQGKIEEAQEWLLVIKTTAQCFELVAEAIQELHSYAVPECLCLAVEEGNAKYLEWIADSVG